MKRCAIFVCAVVCVALQAGSAEAQAKKPVGTWVKTGDVTVTFTFEAETLTCKLEFGGDALNVKADYGMSKDGVIFGRINMVDKQGGGGPSEGDVFTMRFSVKDGTLTITNLGPDSNADARPLIEGEYKIMEKKK
jgi:hypothetical protein